MIRAVALIWALIAANVAAAVSCEDVPYRGTTYSVCSVDPASQDLRLFLRDDKDQIYGQFHAIDEALRANGEVLQFAMNAGMYHSDRAPVGFYLENGEEITAVVPNAGPGNFGLLPNGIFCIRESRADVFETLIFIEKRPACRFASQSGPMLVIDGELHPRFLIDSSSRYVRNGVGTSADGKRVLFAISHTPVTFHEFGSFFKDALQLPNALYFDGSVSRLYAPQLRRNDVGFALGPIVGVVASDPG